MNDPKAAAAYHPGDGHVTRPDLDALREQFAEAAYRAEKTHDFGESWTEEFADESDSYKATYYAIADALLGILPAALAAERARADQAEQRRDEAQKEVQWWEDWENKVIWHLHPNWEDDIAQIALLTNFIEHAAKLDSVIENAREADGYEGNALTFVWDDDTRTLSAAPTAEQ